MKKLIQIFLGVLLTAATLSVYAQTCTINGNTTGQVSFRFPAVGLIDPDVPDGTVLYSGRGSLDFDYQGNLNYNCNSVAPLRIEVFGAVPAAYNTFRSSISGIGYRVSYSSSAISGPLPASASAPRVGSFSWASGQPSVELVKIGPIPNGGTFNFYLYAWYGGALISITTTNSVIGGGSGGAIELKKKPTCSVSTPSIGVDLGRIPVKDFSGIGTTNPQEKTFNISLACAGGTTGLSTAIYSTLTDQTNSANQSDTLTLTTNSTARGVGIQVLSGSTIIKYGSDSAAAGNLNQWLAGAAGNGTFNIPLTARLIQTSPIITPGSVNGRVTFTMSYQ